MSRVPHIVGYQCAGTVVAVGDQVTLFNEGDRVVTVGLDGSHAELRSVAEPFCLEDPRRPVHRRGGLCARSPSARPTIACSSSGVCRAERPPSSTPAAVAWESPPSSWPSGPAPGSWPRRRSDDKLERLVELGLDEGINYVRTDFVDEVRRLTDGRGADVVVDSVGGIDPAGEHPVPGLPGPLRDGGRCRTSGHRTDGHLHHAPEQPVPDRVLHGGGVVLERSSPRLVARHLDDIAAGRLRVVIDRRFPLADAADAHAYIESRQAFGRVILHALGSRWPMCRSGTGSRRGGDRTSRRGGRPIGARRRRSGHVGLTGPVDPKLDGLEADEPTGSSDRPTARPTTASSSGSD
jgi:NADPH2:quinone reductase